MKNSLYFKIIVIGLLLVIGFSIFIIVKSKFNNNKKLSENKISFDKQESKKSIDRSVFKSIVCSNPLNEDINSENDWEWVGDKRVRVIIECSYDQIKKTATEKWGIMTNENKDVTIWIADLQGLGAPSISYAGKNLIGFSYCYEGCGGITLVKFNDDFTQVIKITKLDEFESLDKFEIREASLKVINNKLIFIAPRHIIELAPDTLKTTVLVEVKENEMIGQQSELPSYQPEYAILKERLYYSVYKDDNRYMGNGKNIRSYVGFVEIK